MNPARTGSLGEAPCASAGASLSVGTNSLLKRATFMAGGYSSAAAGTKRLAALAAVAAGAVQSPSTRPAFPRPVGSPSPASPSQPVRDAPVEQAAHASVARGIGGRSASVVAPGPRRRRAGSHGPLSLPLPLFLLPL